jgi:hypothetical protein
MDQQFYYASPQAMFNKGSLFYLYSLYDTRPTIITKQFSCMKPRLWTTTIVDDWTRLIHYTFFKTKCNFRSLKKYFIDKYIYIKY